MRASRWPSTGGMWLFGLRAPYGVSPTTKPESVIALGSQLQSLHPLAVVLESARGPTRQVRDFAQATGRLAKTDALDAQILANFAETGRPHGAWERLARSLHSCASFSYRSNSFGPNRSRGSIYRTTR